MDPDMQAEDELKVTDFKKTMEFKLESGEVLTLEQYTQQRMRWPRMGHHILGTFTDTAILVYQAFNKQIADYAIREQKFDGCLAYTNSRMTWIKPNFLWMMYRSNWAKSKDQERILGIWLKLDAFHELLALAEQTSPNRLYKSKEQWTKAVQTQKTLADGSEFKGKVNIQWDPDHTPSGGKMMRRAIQIGIKQVPWWPTGERFERIIDVTEFVHEQRPHAQIDSSPFPELWTPQERIYMVPDEALAVHCGADSSAEDKKDEEAFLLKNVLSKST